MAKKEKSKKDKRHFFKDFKAELKKVVWPSTKQLVNNTTAVITIVLITAIIVIVLDLAFETANKFRVDKLTKIIEARNTEEVNNAGNTVTSSEEEQSSQESENSEQNNEE